MDEKVKYIEDINDLADAAKAIAKRKADKDPIERLRQQLEQRQLTVSYGGIYKIDAAQ
jgi:hypothetical protein